MLKRYRFIAAVIVLLPPIAVYAYLLRIAPNVYSMELEYGERSQDFRGPTDRGQVTAYLPFDVALIGLATADRTADRGQLTVMEGAVRDEFLVTVGGTVTIGDTPFRVEAIRPWAGLLYRLPGTPMILISVRDDESQWIENVFLGAGAWAAIDARTTVFCDWPRFDAAAEPAARWGVREGDQTHWFTSFVPGTGMEFADGTIVTLLERRVIGGQAPEIVVELARPERAEPVTVVANSPEQVHGILYEDPAAFPVQWRILVHHSDALEVTLTDEGRTFPAETIGLERDYSPIESDRAIRIEQMEPYALPLHEGETPWLEVVLVSDDLVVGLREEEVKTVDGHRIQFEAAAAAQSPSCTLEFATMDGTPFESATIAPGESATVRDWTFTFDRQSRRGGVVLAASTEPNRWPPVGFVVAYAAIVIAVYVAIRRPWLR